MSMPARTSLDVHPASEPENVPTAADHETRKEIRITNQGKMRSWIPIALKFFEELEPDTERTLVLHTLPLANPPSKSTSTSMSSATSLVSRLISVVEIIKREFINDLETKKSPRELGLFQYNEIGTLEELGIAPTGTAAGGMDRASQIIHALGGQNHPRQTQTPFMRITLSTVERPDLVAAGASYQPPIVRKFSKSARARAKKRAKKALKASATSTSEPEEAMEL